MRFEAKAPRQLPLPPGDGKAHAYARFIPREELSSFATWKPGALAQDEPAATESAAAPAPGGRDETREEVAEQLKRARQSGYQDGYRDGLVALEGFKQSFAQQNVLQIGQLMRSIGGQLDGLQQEMAAALTQAAVALARQVVRSELDLRQDAVALVAAEALEALLLSARHITLRVHPDDVALVSQGAGEALSARGARLIGDAGVSRGGCLIESSIGAIDASIETRWRRAAAALGANAPWVEPAAAAPADESEAS